MDEVIAKKLLSEWKEKGITEKTLEALEKEDVVTVGDFSLMTAEDRAELRSAGISIGQMNKLAALTRAEGGFTGLLDGTATPGTKKAADRDDRPPHDSNEDSVRSMLERINITGNTSQPEDTITEDNVLRDIKDVRGNPELDEAGKLWDFLIDKHNVADPLLSGPPGGDPLHKAQAGYVRPPTTNISHDDPRAILIMRATTTRAVHITNFLSEESKKRLRNKRQQYLVQQGESLTMKVRDEHPYAGITVLE